MSKIISWNVNSIRKGISEELFNLIEKESPDIICFQETKATEHDAEKYLTNETILTSILEIYPYRYWNNSVRGQAGVSIWCKKKPLNVIKDIPRLFQLKEGRILVANFEDIVILNTYVPNTGRGDVAEEYRKVWHNSIINWLEKQLENDKMFVWCGDLNVVSEPALDTSHHTSRPKKAIAGLKEFEKEHFDEYISLGLTDAYRYLYPDSVSFTWFSNFHNNVGWRLDFFLTNNMSKVKDVIHNKRLSKSISDHTWIMLKLV